MTDDDKPDLKVASEQRPESIALGRAIREASWSLRSLAANILRILAGGGEPDKLHSQLTQAVKVLDAYEREVVSKYGRIGNPVIAALELQDEHKDVSDRSERRRALGMDYIRRGALRQVAGLLSGNRSHTNRSENLIYDGIKQIEEALEISKTIRGVK